MKSTGKALREGVYSASATVNLQATDGLQDVYITTRVNESGNSWGSLTNISFNPR
jgi:hypothetical protein